MNGAKKRSYKNSFLGRIFNKSQRRWVIQQLSDHFYQEFYNKLYESDKPFCTWVWEEHFPSVLYMISSSGQWNQCIKAVCEQFPQYWWIWHILNKVNWIDYDKLNGDMCTHMYHLIKLNRLTRASDF